MWIDDQVLREASSNLCIKVFNPDTTTVVCGAANDPVKEVNLHECKAQGVPVLKRYGGGGTVVLYPGSVVVSIGTWVKRPFQNSFYFDLLNDSLISCLKRADAGCKWSQNGVSDIVLDIEGELRKVVGTSLFRSRNYLLYQASVLVEDKIELIESLLSHPTREPDYRAGRSHRSFVTFLGSVLGMKADSVVELVKTHLASELRSKFGSELIESQPNQIANLNKRIERASDADINPVL